MKYNIGLCLFLGDHFYDHLDIKINVSDLSKAVGISRQAVYSIIDCSSIPKVTTAIKICNYLTDLTGREITVYDLWGNL